MVQAASFCLLLLSGTFDISSSLTYYHVSASMTWQKAQTYCRSNHIDLATVDSMATVNVLNKSYQSMIPANGSMWIGLKRSWSWSTGESLNYTLWTTGQPNASNSEAACGLFDSKGWSNYYCSNKFGFYCFDEDSSNASKTYILITVSKTWKDAQTYCKQYHTDLAIINNSEDSAAFPVNAAYVWIGLISSYWSDGGFSSFRYWAQDNSESSLDDTCTAMDNHGKWISKQCNLKMSFICYGGES
ncbi:macrophage mannose receptor 1-like [Silurus meridionalis]|uniref:C-type lectin domain-containing protein n=1 Tax=Silurus meridionalis TaxID=175797 RepID=A0A8T0ALH7_SILME|nr:macrophage mannose receptor 1-like [Silurus meridionalis]KAF7692571.1 hypothetical protein HF521_010181 [Silurus meridionalis]KAI5092845.1 putative protein with Lectin C-type domains precursor [Silurus meridionalis]